MIWATDGTKNARGGYIRLYNAEPGGYSNGVWRTEGNVMAHVEEFAPLTTEKQGPVVARVPKWA